MQIRWINDIDPGVNRIFDSLWEAEKWADSLSSDFWAADMDHVGSFALDEKVYSFLYKLLPEWLVYSHSPLTSTATSSPHQAAPVQNLGYCSKLMTRCYGALGGEVT